jgi:hypothetical protein
VTLVVIIAMGIVSAYINIWSAVTFNESLEERINNLLSSVVIDVIMLALFTWIGSGGIFTLFLIGKYAFLAFINFDKTLRQ